MRGSFWSPHAKKGAREWLLRVRGIDVAVLGAMATEMQGGGGGCWDMRLFAAKNTRRGGASRGLCLGENRCDGAVWANRAIEKPFSLHRERRKSTCIFMTWKIMGCLSVLLRVFWRFCGKMWSGKK